MSEHFWVPNGTGTTSSTCAKCGDVTDAGEPPKSLTCPVEGESFGIHRVEPMTVFETKRCPTCGGIQTSVKNGLFTGLQFCSRSV